MKINKLTLQRSFNKTKFKARKHAPTIMIIGGAVGVVGGTIMACVATTRLDEVLAVRKEKIDKLNQVMETPEVMDPPYSEEEYTKDILKVNAHAVWDITKLYAPSFMVMSTSLFMILYSHKIMRGRNVALTAALGSVFNEFKEYRERVAERFGEETERDIFHNAKTEVVEETVVDEDGNEKVVSKVIKKFDNDYSEYARFFDVGNPNWTKDPEDNLWFLKQQLKYANQKLVAKGYLFLNDVYEALGLEKTKAGHVMGWVYDPNSTDKNQFVNFGIFDEDDERARAFVNGDERSIILDFNVAGNVWEMM